LSRQRKMALFKVCSRTVTQRIVTQRVVAPAFLSLRRNFGIKDTLDKYRDDGTTKFEDGMDTMERETKKLMKQPVDAPDTFKFDQPPLAVPEGTDPPSNTGALEKVDGDPVATAKSVVEELQEEVGFEVEEEEHTIHLDTEMETKPDMTIEEAQKVAEEVYNTWPKDHSLPINDALPFAEKMKAADLDGSYGPQKAEFDTWKRIYKEEEQFERLGLPPRAHYWRDGEMYAPYGTLSNPVKIYSQFSHRIVGCHGGNGQPHEVAWINLGNKYKTMCPECGQMFMLVNYFPKEHEEPGEDLHEISRTQNDGHLKEPQLY